VAPVLIDAIIQGPLSGPSFVPVSSSHVSHVTDRMDVWGGDQLCVFITGFHESYLSIAYMQSDCVWLLCKCTEIGVQGSLCSVVHILY